MNPPNVRATLIARVGVQDADLGYRITEADVRRTLEHVRADAEFVALVGQARLTGLARQRFYLRLQGETRELLAAVRAARGT